ncbi:MAG: D-2-hydroxyacid dehydrogenase [Clostridiales bacterium]|nr:D-2-hydroxyacid dehydrogenase [Clostridiales bacterium]
MDIVVLDGYTINPGDLSWDSLEELGDSLTVYDLTPAEELINRIGKKEVIMTSKCFITREIIEKCPDLKYIGSMATGYNNIDVKAAAEAGIVVTNVPAYSTDAVAQHTIALLLELANNAGLHNASVQSGDWSRCEHFCYWKKPVMLLAGKSIGIIGYGAIGSKVAEIARALGMTVNIYSRDPEAAVSSDVISLHCPLTEENAKMIDADFISRMKPGAFLINTARGGLVDEYALAGALRSGRLGGAAVDVISREPASEDCPLLGLSNCIITPHMAWSPEEMRQAVIDTITENLKSWMDGNTINQVS